jgi:hypothetical protein
MKEEEIRERKAIEAQFGPWTNENIHLGVRHRNYTATRLSTLASPQGHSSKLAGANALTCLQSWHKLQNLIGQSIPLLLFRAQIRIPHRPLWRRIAGLRHKVRFTKLCEFAGKINKYIHFRGVL